MFSLQMLVTHDLICHFPAVLVQFECVMFKVMVNWRLNFTDIFFTSNKICRFVQMFAKLFKLTQNSNVFAD